MEDEEIWELPRRYPRPRLPKAKLHPRRNGHLQPMVATPRATRATGETEQKSKAKIKQLSIGALNVQFHDLIPNNDRV